jgi:hypothetical protein
MLPKCYNSPSIEKFVYFVYELKISNLYNYDMSSFDNFDSNGEEKHYTQINSMKHLFWRFQN